MSIPRFIVRSGYQYATEICHDGTEASQGNNDRRGEQTLTPSVLSWVRGDVDASLQRRIVDSGRVVERREHLSLSRIHRAHRLSGTKMRECS